MNKPVTDPLALAWLERQVEIAERREIRRLAAEIRERQKELEPLRKLEAERRKANRRSDSFVMVD